MGLNKFYISGLVKQVQEGDCAEAALKEASNACSLPSSVNVTYHGKTKSLSIEDARQKIVDASNAFAELYMLTEDTQMSLAKHYLRDDLLAHDAVVDVYAKSRTNIDQLQEKGVFDSWVRGFIFWKCYNLQRSRSFEMMNNDPVPSGSSDGAASEDEETQVADAFDTMDLHEPLGMLSIPEKEVLLLRYSAGMMPGQIAQEMSLSEQKVRQTLSDGRKHLLKILNAPAGETAGERESL